MIYQLKFYNLPKNKISEIPQISKWQTLTIELGHLESDWGRDLELDAEIKLQKAADSKPPLELDNVPKFDKKPTSRIKQKRNIRQRRDSDE